MISLQQSPPLTLVTTRYLVIPSHEAPTFHGNCVLIVARAVTEVADGVRVKQVVQSWGALSVHGVETRPRAVERHRHTVVATDNNSTALVLNDTEII